MSRRIRLLPEYHYYALWDFEKNNYLDGSELPLSESTIEWLMRWQETYDASLNEEYPPDSGFATPEKEKAFEEDGWAIAQQIQAELGDGYEIYYRDEQVSLPTQALDESA